MVRPAIVRHLDGDCVADITLDMLCRACEMKRAKFIRLFDLAYGLTPRQYICKRRVRFVQRELERGAGRGSIPELASRAGYASTRELLRQFKKFSDGMTIEQYRIAHSPKRKSPPVKAGSFPLEAASSRAVDGNVVPDEPAV